MSDQSIFKTLKSFFLDGLAISGHGEIFLAASDSTQTKQFDLPLFVFDQNLFHEFVVLKNDDFLIFVVVVANNFFNGACLHFVQPNVLFGHDQQFVGLVNVIN